MTTLKQVEAAEKKAKELRAAYTKEKSEQEKKRLAKVTPPTIELQVKDCGDAYAHGGHAWGRTPMWCTGHAYDRT